jgi:hypothetical protein
MFPIETMFYLFQILKNYLLYVFVRQENLSCIRKTGHTSGKEKDQRPKKRPESSPFPSATPRSPLAALPPSGRRNRYTHRRPTCIRDPGPPVVESAACVSGLEVKFKGLAKSPTARTTRPCSGGLESWTPSSRRWRAGLAGTWRRSRPSAPLSTLARATNPTTTRGRCASSPEKDPPPDNGASGCSSCCRAVWLPLFYCRPAVRRCSGGHASHRLRRAEQTADAGGGC